MVGNTSAPHPLNESLIIGAMVLISRLCLCSVHSLQRSSLIYWCPGVHREVAILVDTTNGGHTDPVSLSHLVRAVSHQANCGVLECGHQRSKSTRCVPGKGGKRRRRRGRVTLSVGCYGTQLLHVLTQYFHLSFTYIQHQSWRIEPARLHVLINTHYLFLANIIY